MAAMVAGSMGWPSVSGAQTLVTPVKSAASTLSTLEAEQLEGRLDFEVQASGSVDFRQGSKRIQADRLTYNQLTDVAHALGQVTLSSDGNWFMGPELKLNIEQFDGYFIKPTYFIARTQAGGNAERWDFIDRNRASATAITYTSCPRDGSGDPHWLLSADRIDLDFERNEGIAQGAVMRFYGVPILAAPTMSFPLSDARKSGWLPFSTNVDNKGGFQIIAPYYWNIAPNRDAKLIPVASVRRGLGMEIDFRYLEPSYEGQLMLHGQPDDQLLRRNRGSVNFVHHGTWGEDTQYHARVFRVSDDDYWKDFSRNLAGQHTQRLLEGDAGFSRSLGRWTAYADVKRWQVLQDLDPSILIDAPYDRLPRVGVRTVQPLAGALEWGVEAELNRYVNPDGYQRLPTASSQPRPTGLRAHALGTLSWAWVTPGWTLVPKLSLNMASYELDQALESGNYGGRTHLGRVIPSLSVDSGWVFERETDWFGRNVRQSLEPRLLYVNTPYRAQAGLPNFDSTVQDFNVESIYSDNAFSGIDRVSDGNQLTAGVTTRLLNLQTGVELVRMGAAQRMLFKEQRVTLDDGPAATQSLSDLLVFGSSNLWRRWYLDSAVQYSHEAARMTRSVVAGRYSPGPYRTFSMAYRLKQGESEQAEFAWQWPLYGHTGAKRSSPGSCRGAWYSAGRVNYSLRESRITDSVLAIEYDSGCWIGRLVAKRLSTSQNAATLQFGIQLEFVGLSKLGAGNNPLKVLSDNVPGYLPLQNERVDSFAP